MYWHQIESMEEIRLVFDAIGLFDIDYRAITGIYFGYRGRIRNRIYNGTTEGAWTIVL